MKKGKIFGVFSFLAILVPVWLIVLEYFHHLRDYAGFNFDRKDGQGW